MIKVNKISFLIFALNLAVVPQRGETDIIKEQFNIAAKGQIAINFTGVDGNIFIERHDKNEVLFELKKELKGTKSKQNLEYFEKILPQMESTENKLTIKIKGPEKNQSISGFTVKVTSHLVIPADSKITIEVADGDINVSDPKGNLEIRNISGSRKQIVDQSSIEMSRISQINRRVASLIKEVKGLTAKMNYLLDQTQYPEKNNPNVILIINEALRGDCLSYCGGDAITPALDSLTSRGITFKNAISQSGWTTPSITSIFTGHYPIAHCKFNRHRSNSLDESLIRLQEVFRANGYYTAAFVAKNYGEWFQDVCNRGFLEIRVSQDDMGIETISRVIEFLRNERVSPYFIFIHIYNPHFPYRPQIRAECPKGIKFKDSICRYLNYLREVEELDIQYRRLFDFLDDCPSNIFDPNKDIIIFTADHGEEFIHENGFKEHGRSPSIECQRVPLIFLLPNLSPRMIDRYCEITSIYPTLMDLLDFEQPLSHWNKLSPTSLIDLIENPTNDHPYSYSLSEALFKDIKVPDVPEIKTLIRSDGYKLDYNTRTKESRLYYLPDDPKEENNLLVDDHYQSLFDELYAELIKRTLINYDYR